jgi:7-keto-8-aminopelargonate synthetase-like enzyme
VPEGTSRVRFSFHADHADADLDRLEAAIGARRRDAQP